MIVDFSVTVRDLFSNDLREALSLLESPLQSSDDDIVAVARSIVFFPDEDYWDHRYTGEFFVL